MIHVIQTDASLSAFELSLVGPGYTTDCRCGAEAEFVAPKLGRSMCPACAARVAAFTPLQPIEAVLHRAM